MKQWMLVALLAFSSQSDVQAEVVWEHVAQAVTDSQSITVDVDKSSIRQRDGFRQGWFRMNVMPPNLATNGKEYSSAVLLHLANCKQGEITLLKVTAYREIDLQGDVVERIQIERSSAIFQLSEPSPESIRRAVRDVLCQGKLN